MLYSRFESTLTLAFLLCLGTCTRGTRFSAIFIFGDSIADVGNNNYITTLSKANYYPNGIDFGKATGRFTNGRTVFDILGQSFGFKNFTPPYLAPSTAGPVILHGVNYASGAGGILNESGANYFGRISMDAQLHNFARTRHDIISIIGAAKTRKLNADAFFSVTMGSNDFINNYLLQRVSNQTAKHVPPSTFTRIMISTFRKQLTKLYDLGARKIVVSNIPPIGCSPHEKDFNFLSLGDKCVASDNVIVQQYNRRLKRLLIVLRTTLKGSTFVYADVYHIVEDIIGNYKLHGFEIADVSCCGTLGLHNGLVPCLPNAKFCPDRSKYIFWDPYHVTETTNIIIAKRLLDGDSDDISPMSLRALSRTLTRNKN